jgi:hypothetical protein
VSADRESVGVVGFCRRIWKTDRTVCLFAIAYWLVWAVSFECSLSAPDGVGYYSYTQSLVVKGDLSIDEEFERWRLSGPFRELTERGYARNVFAIGTSLLWIPFVAVAHSVGLLLHLFHVDVNSDGYGYHYIYAANLGTAIYGFFALILCYRTASIVTSRGIALIATIALGVFSSFWNYLFFQGSFSHVCDAFSVALFISILVRTIRPLAEITCAPFGRDDRVCSVAPPRNIPNIPRRRALHTGSSRSETCISNFCQRPKNPRKNRSLFFADPESESSKPIRNRTSRVWLLLGTTAGLTVLTRWQNIIFPALIAARLLFDVVLLLLGRFSSLSPKLSLWDNRPTRALLLFVVGSLLTFLPQLIIWRMQFGTLIAVPQGEGFLNWSRPDALTVLFSPHHGLYSWTPMVFLATIPGLYFLVRKRRGLGMYFISAFIFQIYINSIVFDVGAGGSFGARRFVGLTIIYVLGLAAFISRVPRWLSGFLIGAAAIWTFPLWLAFKSGILDSGRFASLPQVLDAMGKTIVHIPMLLRHMRVQNAENISGSAWIIALFGVALFIAIVALLWLSLARRPSLRIITTWAITGIVLVDSAVAAAAFRTRPAPAPVRYEGEAAMIDFGWYTNSRYDSDPFRPGLNSIRSLVNLSGGIIHWREIPFQIRDPAGYKQASASVATSCVAAGSSFVVDLQPRKTEAIHLALSAIDALEPGAAVAQIDVAYEDGSVTTSILKAYADIWDFIANVPATRVVYSNSVGSVTGYSRSLDPDRIPVRLILRDASVSRSVHPCFTLLAVTQQLARKSHALTEARTRPKFLTVDIASIANADHGRDLFEPLAVANCYPDLSPGHLRFNNVPFWILNRNATPTGGTTITSMTSSGFRQRIPLSPVRSTRLSFLLDGMVVPSLEYPVADIVIEYKSGPSEKTPIWAQRDVWNYWDFPPMGKKAWRGSLPQDLTYFEIPMDRSRVPEFIWFNGSSTTTAYGIQGGVTIFAITQTRYVSQLELARLN